MDDLSAILASIFSSGTFNEMLRRATPVALAAIGGSLTEHAGIMNIGMDGMILMGAFFGVLGSWLFASAAAYSHPHPVRVLAELVKLPEHCISCQCRDA